jgi:hypothetical protein
VCTKANVDLDEGERDGVSCDDDEDGFVLVRATKGVVPVVGEIVSSTVYTAASAAKGAVAAAAVTAAMNYGTSAVVSYTFETVGVTAIARGAYVSSLRPPCARAGRAQSTPPLTHATATFFAKCAHVFDAPQLFYFRLRGVPNVAALRAPLCKQFQSWCVVGWSNSGSR